MSVQVSTQAGPAEGESLAEYARRCWEVQQRESRPERAALLLRLLERLISWPPDRVSVVYDRRHEAFAWVDSVQFRHIADEQGDHLLVAGDDDWYEVRSAAELSELLRSGRLRGRGA